MLELQKDVLFSPSCAHPQNLKLQLVWSQARPNAGRVYNLYQYDVETFTGVGGILCPAVKPHKYLQYIQQFLNEGEGRDGFKLYEIHCMSR